MLLQTLTFLLTLRKMFLRLVANTKLSSSDRSLLPQIPDIITGYNNGETKDNFPSKHLWTIDF